MRTPWHRDAPSGVAAIETDDDEFLTIDKWPRDVFKPHYHEEFNWLVLSRPGRMVVRVADEEHTIDANHWLCIFPRTPHAVVFVSDDCEVLSLFIPDAPMYRAFEALQLRGPVDSHAIVGGAGVVAQGLAFAWGERRFSLREHDAVDDALIELVTRWIWRAHRSSITLAPTWVLRARLKLGPLGEAMTSWFDRHLADSPFPWDALVRDLGVSRRTLQRRCFEAIGVGPSGLLAGMRLDRGRELLAEPGRSVGDIALACGFASQSHFSTTFKAEHGASPAAYRLSLTRKDVAPGL